MIVIKQSGNFNNIDKFLSRAKKIEIMSILERYGQKGVSALSLATPVDTGKTANSWGYKVYISNDRFVINWTNSNVVNGVPIAIIIQYGHATRNGGYVPGRDYINPAIRPILDEIANESWKEVTQI